MPTALPTPLPEPLLDIDVPLTDRRVGKVRVSYALPGRRRLLVTTDRLSAFDRIIAGVPYKGQVLNQLSWWWFEHTRDIVANHAISTPDPNVLIATAATPLTVEVIVRGYITGVTDTALWTRYAAGQRTIYGHRFADGLRKNTPLDEPIVTPTGDDPVTAPMTSRCRRPTSSPGVTCPPNSGVVSRLLRSGCSSVDPNAGCTPG